MKLSVIVPIYKVEKYLRKCIDSILNQDLSPEEYEIILVDDGSPDNCGTIADEYAAKYKNIKVIHQENGGLSVARNTGIDAATGKYIQFVDSDDFLEPNVLKGLVDKMEADNLDVLRFDYQNINESNAVFEPYKEHRPYADFKDEICDGPTFLNERLGFACYAIQFMIKSSIIREGDLRFKPGIYFEDTEWAPRLLSNAKSATSVSSIIYNYLLRVGSITTPVEMTKKQKIINDKISLISDLKKQSLSVNDTSWYEGMISLTVISILGLVRKWAPSERKSIIYNLTELDIFPLSSFHTVPRVKRKIRIINFSPAIYCSLLNVKSAIL